MTNQPIEEKVEELSLPKKEKKSKKILIIILCVVLGFAIVLTSAYFILLSLGKDKLVDNTGVKVEQNEEFIVNEDMVTYKGENYKVNPNITSILVVGVDKENVNEQSSFGHNGQADTIFLVSLDTKTKAVKIVPISRETMVDFDRFSVDGQYAGIKNGQICLSYAYGNDAKSGSENVKSAVSRLLCGVNINSFVTVDLRVIWALTEAVGGVEVTSLETVEPFVKGEKVTLKGRQAVWYVQRRGTDVDANNRRQARQKQFLKAFASKAGNKIVSDFTKLIKYYNTAKPYFTSDLDLSEITYLAKTCLSKDIGEKLEYVTISGETKMGEKYVEFYPEENSVYEAVLNAFYEKID